jgi:hypothetical protein
VHSATRPEISSLTFGAPGRGQGFRFLLVFLLSMMVQIVEHRADTSEDSWWRKKLHPPRHEYPAARWLGLLLCTLRGSTRLHRHLGLRQGQSIARTPSRAVPGALSAARELLRHPPSSTASSGAMKQWRDDVDWLLGMAHSTSMRSRPRSSRRQHEAMTSVRSPSVRGAQTDDLRAELNRRHAGEDARVFLERARERRQNFEGHKDTRVSLERARERRQNIEGRNLDQDFVAVTPQTLVGARYRAGVPLTGVVCAALADHLRAVSWPSKFWPHLPEKYNGTSNSSGFLQVYVTAITAAGGNTAVMTTYFHVALSGPARTWLMNLAPGSIYS